ncbi:GNAT family N-acetyltransferase [Planctomycetota bacterium]
MEDITIRKATDDDLPVVLNLIKFYIYDMSKSTGWDCNSQGIFDGCDDSREYWQRRHRDTDERNRWDETVKGHPFMIESGTGFAGFVLIKEFIEDQNTDYDVGEFFITGKYQSRGIGQYVARSIFNRLKGRWSVRQLKSNTPARKFWEKIISEYTNDEYEISEIESDGYEMIFLTFNNS